MDSQALCLRYLMGEATEQEVAALNAWLAESPANAEQFALLAAQETSMTAAVGNICAPSALDVKPDWVDQALAMRKQHEIEDEANKQLAQQQAEEARNRRFELRRNAPPEPVKRDIIIPKVVIWLGLAAAVLIGAVLIGINTKRPATDPTPPTADQQDLVDPQPAPATPTPVATLTLLEDAVWSGTNQRLSLHSRITPGPLHLESGIAHFVMDSGAMVMVKGPATIDLASAWVAELSEGSAVARVPVEAQGFQVVGNGFEITDLGTEFAVHVGEDGVQCRVILGEVELSIPKADSSSPEPLRLRENRLVYLDTATGEVNELGIEDAEDIAWALPYTDSLGRNLVINGDFEAQPAPVFTPGEALPTQAIPGWVDQTSAISVSYRQVSSLETWPDLEQCPIPTDAGDQFMVTIGESGSIYQDVDLASLAPLTDRGLMRADLSAWLGGYDLQDQYAVVSVEFLDDRGHILDTIALDPVRPANRGYSSGFVLRVGSETIPAQSRLARVRIESAAGEPDDVCDGYVDNVELVFKVERAWGDALR